MINKYAELQNRALLYNACKGILRVKQAGILSGLGGAFSGAINGGMTGSLAGAGIGALYGLGSYGYNKLFNKNKNNKLSLKDSVLNNTARGFVGGAGVGAILNGIRGGFMGLTGLDKLNRGEYMGGYYDDIY